MFAAIMLILVYVILMVSIHSYAAGQKKILELLHNNSMLW